MDEFINNPIVSACMVFAVSYMFKDIFIAGYTAIMTTYTRQFEVGDALSIQAPDNQWEGVKILEFRLNPIGKRKTGVYVRHADKTIERIEFRVWRNYRKKSIKF